MPLVFLQFLQWGQLSSAGRQSYPILSGGMIDPSQVAQSYRELSINTNHQQGHTNITTLQKNKDVFNFTQNSQQNKTAIFSMHGQGEHKIMRNVQVESFTGANINTKKSSSLKSNINQNLGEGILAAIF